MRRNKDRANADGSSAPRSRGFGPFSGGQLTLIIVTVVVMVGLPVGAFAVVKGSNSFITDATSGKHAKVSASGQLATSGTVSGSVTATPAQPAAMVDFSTEVSIATNGFSGPVSGTTAASKALIVTAITVGPHGVLNSSVPLSLETYTTGTQLGLITLNPGSPPVTLPFPSGLPIKGPDYLVIANSGPPVTLDVTVSGYYVPVAQCANACYQ